MASWSLGGESGGVEVGVNRTEKRWHPALGAALPFPVELARKPQARRTAAMGRAQDIVPSLAQSPTLPNARGSVCFNPRH